MKKWLPGVLLSLCAACFAVVEGPHTVIAVTDGDTIRVQRGATPTSIRLIAVDTPEKTKDRAKDGIHGPRQSGFDASRALAEIVPVNAKVWLWSEGPELKLDPYRRPLAVVYLDQQLTPTAMLQHKLLAGGWSPLVTKYNNVPKWLAESLSKVEGEAREAGTGLWKTDPEYMEAISAQNRIGDVPAAKEPVVGQVPAPARGDVPPTKRDTSITARVRLLAQYVLAPPMHSVTRRFRDEAPNWQKMLAGAPSDPAAGQLSKMIGAVAADMTDERPTPAQMEAWGAALR